MEKIKRKKQNKTRNKIKKLFRTLRRQSMKSLDTTQDDTVIALDTTEQDDTVIFKDNTIPTGLKRKISTQSNESAKRIRTDSSVILTADNRIPDINLNNIPYPLDSPKRCNLKIKCSTPIIRKDSNTLQDLIINNFSTQINETENINEDIINLTKEIHKDSYITIDLTADSEIGQTNNNIVDLDKTSKLDNTLVTLSNTSLSMSGDSDVTVLQNNRDKHDESINKFAKCISKLNSTEKGRLLDLIAKNIFSGCKISNDFPKNLNSVKSSKSEAIETEQDTFIKEVILGEAKSRNSIGSNIYHPSKDVKNKRGLRMIVIDGSNVAMEHTRGSEFSVEGLKICIDYFVRRGHVVKAFVPRFRCKYGKSSNPRMLDSLERQGLVIYTPSREIRGRMCTSYDDRYIVQCAAEFDGVIVSGDNYRDLLRENPRWRSVIENRLLPFTWVDNMIMFPKDPLGRNGPTLEQFLKHPNPGPTIVL